MIKIIDHLGQTLKGSLGITVEIVRFSCRLVARSDDAILGWVALSPASGRCVYSGVAEVSIYIGQQYQGHKVGTALLETLIKISEKNGYWTLQSGIIR